MFLLSDQAQSVRVVGRLIDRKNKDRDEYVKLGHSFYTVAYDDECGHVAYVEKDVHPCFFTKSPTNNLVWTFDSAQDFIAINIVRHTTHILLVSGRIWFHLLC